MNEHETIDGPKTVPDNPLPIPTSDLPLDIGDDEPTRRMDRPEPHSSFPPQAE